jgi:hypothetical protein
MIRMQGIVYGSKAGKWGETAWRSGIKTVVFLKIGASLI